MKKILNYLLLIAVSMFSVQAFAAKKEKKAKAPYVWDWNGVYTGNANFDEYLTTVTNIWNEIEEYEQTYSQFSYKIDTLSINGKYYLLAYMDDAAGNMVSRSRVNWQVANSVLSATSIVLDATNASLLTAMATLELPNLGLEGSILNAKYIKGGPMVIKKGMEEIGAIAKINKANARSWKAMKTAAIDPAQLGYFSDEALKNMKKCCYLKEIVETDPEYEAIMTIQTAKTPEELKAEADKIGDTFAAATILPEDENKSLNNLDDLSDLEE